MKPFDQYIAIDPEWLFSRESENAIVDPDNLLIELAHLRAAAAEMPLSLDDIALFPDLGEMIPGAFKRRRSKKPCRKICLGGTCISGRGLQPA